MNTNKPKITPLLAGALGWMSVVLSCSAAAVTAPVGVPAQPDASASKAQLVEAYGKFPLSFEANQGQTDKQARFLARGPGYSLFLTPTEAVLTLRKQQEVDAKHSTSPQQMGIPSLARKMPAALVANAEGSGTTLRMRLVSANANPVVEGIGELPGKVNYFRGKDPKQWRINIPTYARVHYKNVYPGIDLVYYGNQRQLEHDFIIAPGGDPNAIRLTFAGADTMGIDKQGDLVLKSAGGEVSLRKPRAYQDIDGQQREVDGRYVLRTTKSQGKSKVGFQVAAYDKSKPLVIDPVLAYSTYLGGSDVDYGRGIAVDGSGHAYVTGTTASTNFPTVNAQ